MFQKRIAIYIWSLMLLASVAALFAGTAFAGSSAVTWETLPQFCRSNVAQIKGPVRGIAVEHHGLGCLEFQINQTDANGWMADRGIVYLHPHYSPWAWMNRYAVKLTDDLVSAVKGHYRLADDVPIVSYGGSMGGQGCLIWPVYSRHRVSSVVANCPVTDLVYHYTERPDLPRSIGCAFAYADDLADEIRQRSPYHQINRMPDIPYTILHGTKDDRVSKSRHSDRFVAAMRQAGRRVVYEASEGMGHGPLTERTQRVFNAAILAPAASVTFPVPETVKSWPDSAYDTNGVKAVWIESVPWKGCPTRVFAYYSLPPGATDKKKVPGIVLVHGGCGTAFSSWVTTWNKRGYAAIAMDTCGGMPGEKSHCPEHPRHAWSGPNGWGRFEDELLPAEEQWPYHAVEAVIRAHTFLGNLPEVDAARIGVTGISWGGVLTAIACGVDSRFAFAVPVYGCGNLRRHSVWSDEIGACWDALWDPSRYVGNCRVPTLWCTGTNDHFFPLDSFAETARATGDAILSIKVRMPHGQGAGDAPEIAAFADSIVRGAPKLTERKVVRREWVSTQDDNPVWEKRTFTVTKEHPARSTVLFENAVTEDGMILSSWPTFAPCLASPDLAKTHPVSENVRGHENVEWSVGYAFHLTDEKKGLPRVLLAGDSICNGYQGEVQKRLEGKMNVSYWASSYCVTSPGYLKLLDFYLSEADYDVVHFNNGCHSFSTPTEDWKRGLRAALRLIRERQPGAKIVWSSTTPNRKAKNNEAVARINAAALSVVAEFGGIRTNDLYAAMDKLDATHQSKAYWSDDYHFTPAAIRIQAGLVAAACLAASRPAADEPWLIVNEDNDHYFKNPSELMTEKALADYIDYTCRGKVTHFFMCPSGQRASFDSKTWEPIWKGIGESARPDTATGPNGTRDRWCVNAKLLCDKGIDPYAVWTKRCRERGVSPWMTLRMNDVHYMDNTNYFRNTTFCKTRRDLWLRPDAKGWTDYCLDYAKKDTQDYTMAHLVEVAERYDIDGIELDWMRSGVNLRRGHEREDARCMTAFMRDVRRRLDEIGAKRGRRIALGIRACYDPDLALDRMGMDVAAWAKEGLVDLVVPTGIYFADAGISVSKWVERIGRANPAVRVIPCIDYCHKQRGKQTWMDMAKFRWVANRFYEQGAAGIYLFNLPYLGKYPTDGKLVPNDVAAEIFTEGLSPETIAGKDQTEIAVFHDFDEADLASFVDPFVGTAGTGHTTPAACVPFGMVQAGPDTGFGDWPHCSGYIYGDKTICGFTQTHLNGTGCPDLGDLRIVPMRSEKLTVNSEQLRRGGLFDKASEVAEPGYYAVTLKEPAVRVEIAAAAHSAIYRFTPMRGLGEKGERGELRLLIEPKAMFFNPPEFPEKPTETLAFERTKDAQGGVTGLSGAYRASCWVTREVGYAVEFDREARCVSENVYAFRVKWGEPLTVKVGLAAGGGRTRRSASLPERARRNLAAEIAGWDFEGVKAAARAKWNEVLGVATIEGTEEQKRNWYTALYHLCVQPNNIADVGEKPSYSTFSCWDTFRAAGPLYTILYPDKAAAFVDSMLEQGKRTGHLPIWTLWGQDNQCMIGTHSVPMIVDGFLKESKSEEGKVKECGRIRFWEDAYAQIKETLTKRHEGRKKENWDLYDKYGYYPFDLIRGESVSRTLECAYDDWCAGVMAEKLGHKEDAESFFKRAGYWKNVFDPSIGFVRGKDSKGNWRTPYDPYALGHGAGMANDFTEGNAFQYSWHVMQDVPGLVAAMGGREKFLKKLDSLFEAPSKTDGMGEVLDVTGLIGQYVHGNEPSHHVIYFYPQVGEPRKAAERIREVFDKFYLPKPDGLCGNDDCGQMSAWYLFSAMGFYPFNPCGGEYVIGAPQVAKVSLWLPSQVKVKGQGQERTGNFHSTPTPNAYTSFIITAKNLSKENKYVKSVTLNGKPVSDWKIRHSDIMAGGELVFEMGK